MAVGEPHQKRRGALGATYLDDLPGAFVHPTVRECTRIRSAMARADIRVPLTRARVVSRIG